MSEDEKQLNEKWDIRNVVQKAVETAHITPAPETLAKLNELRKTMEENYSKRELDEHFKDMSKRFNFQDDLLTSLNTKVGLQNGRVTKLETKIGGWIIAIGCMTGLFCTLVGAIIWGFNQSQKSLKAEILLEIAERK